MSSGKSGWAQGRALLLVALILFSAFSVGVGYGLTLNGTWSGDWFTEKYGNFTSGLKDEALTSGRVVIAGTQGLLGDDADLIFTGGDTLNVANISATDVYTSSLYVNGEKYYNESAADYLLWVSGSTYYCRDGHTGETTNGTVFSDLWQTAQDSMTNGGKIELANGLYIVTKTLNITNPSVEFCGQTMWRGTTPSTDPQTSGLKLANNADVDVIKTIARKTSIHNLCIDGNKDNNAAGTGIYNLSGGAGDFHCYEVYVIYANDYGIRWAGDNGAAENVYIEFSGLSDWYVESGPNTFDQCSSWSAGQNGFYGASSAYGLQIIGFHSSESGKSGISISCVRSIIASSFVNSAQENGILISADYNIVTGNTIYECGVKTSNTYYGILLGTNVNDCIITDNLIYRSVDRYYACIAENAGCNYNIMTDNNVRDGYVTIPVLLVGAGNQIHHNLGFVTENSGTAQIIAAATTVVVTHGCSYTPSAKDLTLTATNSTSAALHVYADTFTATQFTITSTAAPAAGAPFSWHITKTP